MRLSDLQAQLQEGIQLAQAGQRTEARRVFEEIVQEDPNVAIAWLWLATVSTDREERIRFLERSLILDPTNARAQEAYTKLTGAPFTPPVGVPDMTSSGAQRSRPPVLVLMAAVAAIAVLVVAGLLLSGAFDSAEATPTSTPTQVRLTPSNTPGPSPTATWTPLPTHTPGPSPTSIWDAPPATWTPLPTDTIGPTATTGPSSTPLPTRTPTLTLTPDATQTAEFALTSDGSAAN